MRLALALVVSFLSVAAVSNAQTFGAATIHGRVTDESGAALPGVTVTGRSPSLQLPTVSVVTDGEGNYQMRNCSWARPDAEVENSTPHVLA